MVSAAVKVAPGVFRIPLMPFDLINSFLLVDEDGQLTLVDAGLKGSTPRIVAGIRMAGHDPSDVTRIVLTHGHNDHVGGLAEMSRQTGAEVAAHADDAVDIRAGRGTPLDRSAWLGRLRSRNLGSAACPIDRELTDGEVIPLSGGLLVVHTPGHTPGHVSLLHLTSGTLITGDAIWNMNSRRTWPSLAACSSIRLTLKAAHRLGDLEYETAAFTHGPEIRGSGRQAIRSFLARPRGFRMFL